MIEWKKVLFYAIIPAIVAGVFTIAPKFYDEYTEPKAVLEYFITKGPMLKDAEGHKSIYAIDVVNNGKKPLSAVNASIKSQGNIEAITTYENTGLSPEITSNPTSISVETLHPGESFTISLMLVTPNIENVLEFVLRSKEVLGSEFKPTDKDKSKKLDWASAIGAAFSVFFMASFFLNRIRKGKPIGNINSYKSDILYYIAVKFGFTDIIDQYGIDEGSITYLRFGDMLLAAANNGGPEASRNAILALKCMLFNKPMLDLSRNSIIRNIKKLEGDEFSEDEIKLIEEKLSSVSGFLMLKDWIDEYSENPSEFLKATDEPNK